MISRLILLLPLLVCVGCVSPKEKPQPPNQEVMSFWKSGLLYLKSTPYDRLYVEVDAVAGCEPSKKELEALGSFLTAHSAKPRGVKAA